MTIKARVVLRKQEKQFFLALSGTVFDKYVAYNKIIPGIVHLCLF